MALVSARQIMDLRVIRRRTPPRRITASGGFVAGFGGYFVIAAGLSMIALPHVVGIALMVAVSGLVGWRTTLPVAAGVGALGWLFYSGFVTHSYGRLGIVGLQDVVVACLLLGVAIGAVLLRIVAARRAARPWQLTLVVFPAHADRRHVR
jgi:heme/copper-type cytochrome/quinol oxidase subunit 1